MSQDGHQIQPFLFLCVTRHLRRQRTRKLSLGRILRAVGMERPQSSNGWDVAWDYTIAMPITTWEQGRISTTAQSLSYKKNTDVYQV